LRDKLNLFKSKNRNKKVLHFAPELVIKWKLKRHTIYQAGDYFSKGYCYDSDVMHLDIMDLPFEDNEYDIIICIHVMEHVADDKKGMSELYRVLRPGGIAFIQAPASPDIEKTRELDKTEAMPSEDECLRRFACARHRRLYAMSDYINRLSNAGFDVEVYKPTADIIEKYNLYKEPHLFVCRKK
jgi:ubiquinone/menaquinone biosynthesis C-methylase UbiE